MRVAAAKKLFTMGTLVAFSFLVMFSEYSFGQTETPLARAQAFFSQGQYDEAVQVLDGYITEIQANPEQKPNLAAANYLLAKVFFEVGDDSKCDEALLKVFSAHPGFDRDESNFGFRERVLKAKARLAGNIPAVAEATTQPVVPQKKIETSETKTGTMAAKVDTRTVEMPKKGTDKIVKKKKKFPLLLVLLGATVIGVVLYLTIFKSKQFDIRGKWLISSHYKTATMTDYYTFQGDMDSGTILDAWNQMTGYYSVNGINVSFSTGDDYVGSFSDKNHMSGTWAGGSFNWEAVRQ